MQLEAADIIAEVRSTDALLDAWRVRKTQLGLSDLYLDELSGTHAAKILSHTKGISRLGFQCISTALALRYFVAVDPEMDELMQGRWQQRTESHVRNRTVRVPLPKPEIARLARMAADLRANASHIERLVAERLVA